MIITDFTLGRLNVVVLWDPPDTRGRRPWWEVRTNNLETGVGRLELVRVVADESRRRGLPSSAA